MTEEHSVTETSRLAAALDQSIDNSRVAAALRVPFREGSRTVATARWLGDAVRSSYVFRWLTAEPEPDVVVIDLRETWTVGPVIAVLDRLAPHGVRMWNGSASRRFLDRTTTAFRSAPVRVTSALVLGVLLAQLALTWGAASTISLVARLFFVALALLGLRVTWTWNELATSRAGQLAEALFVPPEPPDENGRT